VPVLADPAFLFVRAAIEQRYALDRPLVAGRVIDVKIPVQPTISDKQMDGLVDQLQQWSPKHGRHRIGKADDRTESALLVVPADGLFEVSPEAGRRRGPPSARWMEPFANTPAG